MTVYKYSGIFVYQIHKPHIYTQETWKSRNLPNATSSPQSLIIICDLESFRPITRQCGVMVGV